MTQPRLPIERWNGYDVELSGQVIVDKWTPIMNSRLTYPLNDYQRQHKSLLPVLAWQNGAIAFDPGGTETQQRLALANAKRLNLLQGSFEAFDILCASNNVLGFIREVGDYDSAGTLVPREGVTDTDRYRMQGTHSLHSTDPMIEDKVRVARPGFPIGYPGEDETDNFKRRWWDGTVYRKYVAIDIELPPDRGSDLEFAQFITQAAQKTVSFTREVVEVNIVASFRLQSGRELRAEVFEGMWLDWRS